MADAAVVVKHETVAEERAERLFALPDLGPYTGNKSKAAIYAWMAEDPPLFPLPIRVGMRSVVWRESDLIAWQRERFAHQGVVRTENIVRANERRCEVHAAKRAAKLADEAATRAKKPSAKRSKVAA